MSTMVTVRKDGNEILYFRIVEDLGKLYVEQPDAPSIETTEGEDFYTTLAIALLKLKERNANAGI